MPCSWPRATGKDPRRRAQHARAPPGGAVESPPESVVHNPCNHTQVRELLKNLRSGHSKRGVKPHKQSALTKEPLQAVLATCDPSPRGLRDRALLLFGWASGGRRRSEIAGATMEN